MSAVELALQEGDEGTIEYAVLNAARVLYTMDCPGRATREKAGNYALEVLPERWHPIVREALRIRRRAFQEPSLYATMEERMQEAKRFARFMKEYCGTRHDPGLQGTWKEA